MKNRLLKFRFFNVSLIIVRSFFRQLNKLAFIKILKKFDKVSNNVALIIHSFIIASENPVCNHEDPAFLQVTGKQVLAIYLKVVESSYFNSSDKVNSVQLLEK